MSQCLHVPTPVRAPRARNLAMPRHRDRDFLLLPVASGGGAAPLCQECHGKAVTCSRNASECPRVGFCDFSKNGVNMKPVGVNRCYTVSQWTRIPSILPMGTCPCKGERLASTYRHHHFTLYSRSIVLSALSEVRARPRTGHRDTGLPAHSIGTPARALTRAMQHATVAGCW